MRPLNIGHSCVALLAGFAAMSVSVGSVLAASSGVCGIRPDGPKYYESARAAKADGARVMHPGDCETLLCTGVWPKVALGMGVLPSTAICGQDPLTHKAMTYPNDCAIEAAGATWLHAGPCKR
jgi:hypothetical protein